MKEKIMVRIEEVNIWGRLMENLESMEECARMDLSNYKKELEDLSEAEVRGDWRISEIAGRTNRLKAIENIRGSYHESARVRASALPWKEV